MSALNQRDAGAYVNFLGNEGEGRVREAYPGSTWERLAAIKGVCRRFLTPAAPRSVAGYLPFEGKDERAKRVVDQLICDSDFEPISVGRVPLTEASSDTTLRGPREPSQRRFSI